ncbi:MAG: hypothetical protein OXT09_22505 [Myxococcales bacterium]|nr:hypothetical protein [Myxococcales bacterium]
MGHPRSPLLATLGGALLCVAAARAQSLDDGERGKPDAGPCVKSSAHSRYSGYGYDHLVTLENGCKTDMHCRVTTNANPKGVEIDVPKGEERTVITFRGSPAREFDHDAECKPR